MNCSEMAAAAPLYRSGELDPVRTAAVSAHLLDCPACARELRKQQQLDGLLRAGVLAETVDTSRLDQRVRQRVAAELGSGPSVSSVASRWTPWRVAAFACVAALVLLAVGYRHFLRSHNVYADAAADHRSEVVDGHWRPWLTDPAAIATLAERTGIEPHAVLALAPPGYHLARAKRCALSGRPFLHLVYSNGPLEFSAYLRPRDAEVLPGLTSGRRSNGGPYTSDLGAEHVGCVQTPRVTAVIVTDESGAAASDLARFADAALSSPPANF